MGRGDSREGVSPRTAAAAAEPPVREGVYSRDMGRGDSREGVFVRTAAAAAELDVDEALEALHVCGRRAGEALRRGRAHLREGRGVSD
jgi:hypothetical protein